MTHTAHQYRIRLEMSKTEDLDFDPDDIELKNSYIKKISRSLAKEVIIKYEWLKTIPQVTRYCLGLYFKLPNNKEVLGGVLIYSDDYAQNTSVWDKYKFYDKIILLSRGVCLWWTPKNTASYFIAQSYNWLKKNTKYEIITATVDPAAGEIGTIYQALNWEYVGLMSGNYNNNNKESKRFSVLINDKLRYSRSIRKEFGTMKKSVILEKYPDAVFIPQYRKRRYFYFLTKKKYYKKQINHLLMSYPKRNIECNGLIYMIENLVNNKKYIGQTIRLFNDRINDYKNGLGNTYLNASFKKYGWNNFKFSIIDIATNLNELNEKEIDYILKYKSNDRNHGYNIENGGRNSIPSEETKNKMSQSARGRKQSDEWIRKRISTKGSKEALKHGRPKSEEEKKYLSDNSPKYWLGKSRSDETKKRISNTKKENGLSKKQKKIMCKRVIAYSPIDNKVLDIYDSTVEASKSHNISQSTISRRCSGKSENKGNVYFKYENLKK